MIPSYYEFYNPVKIISGNNALDNLNYEIDLLGVRKPFLITDQGIIKAGLLKHIENAFIKTKKHISVFDKVPTDSSIDVINELANIIRESESDCLIALGGGSVIDTAKAVNILISENSHDIMEFGGADHLKKPLKPLIAIPTTTGTGSEMTGVAVIKDSYRKMKLGFSSQFLMPRLAIIDPRMTITLPPFLTAATGIDALTHAIESYYCIQKNPMSDIFAWKAIELISTNLIYVVRNPTDKNGKLALANAACMAGISLANSLAGVIHALGHAIGSVCDIPHGVAMNIFLPLGLEYNIKKVGHIIGELIFPLAGSKVSQKIPEKERPLEVVKFIYALRNQLYELVKLPRTLKEANITKDKLEEIANIAINDGSILFNPEEIEYVDALELLDKAYE